MNKNILITGGAGFIGSHLIERLLKEHFNIFCIDNFIDYYDPRIKRKNIKHILKESKFKLIKADIRDKDKLRRIFKTNNFYKVIHLAAQPGVRYSILKPQLYFDINVNGTLNILDACKENKIKGLIIGSSSSVYGNASKIPFSEKDETYPISPYGASKRAAELLCYTYNHLYHLPITILRFFTVYGPRQRPDMAIYKFTDNINSNKEITLFGKGKTKRDYTYVSDIIDGIFSVLNKNFDFEIFNLGNSDPTPLLYLISLIEKNLKKKAKIRFLSEQPGDPPVTFANIKKSKKMFNYQPKVKIEGGIKNFISWYKNEKS